MKRSRLLALIRSKPDQPTKAVADALFRLEHRDADKLMKRYPALLPAIMAQPWFSLRHMVILQRDHFIMVDHQQIPQDNIVKYAASLAFDYEFSTYEHLDEIDREVVPPFDAVEVIEDIVGNHNYKSNKNLAPALARYHQYAPTRYWYSL